MTLERIKVIIELHPAFEWDDKTASVRVDAFHYTQETKKALYDAATSLQVQFYKLAKEHEAYKNNIDDMVLGLSINSFLTDDERDADSYEAEGIFWEMRSYSREHIQKMVAVNAVRYNILF